LVAKTQLFTCKTGGKITHPLQAFPNEIIIFHYSSTSRGREGKGGSRKGKENGD